MQKIIVNLTEISNCWLEIEFLENGHYLGVLLLIYCAPVSACITSLLDMTIKLQLIYKNHPVVRIRISEAINCKAKCKIDHN